MEGVQKDEENERRRYRGGDKERNGKQKRIQDKYDKKEENGRSSGRKQGREKESKEDKMKL